MTPTARTLAALRKDGWTAGVVEKFNPHVGEHGIRQDFLGCIDIIAVRPGETLGVQATSGGSGGNVSHRVEKIRTIEAAAVWLAAGNRLEVWGWRKRKLKRGGKAIRWEATIRLIDLSSLSPVLQ